MDSSKRHVRMGLLELAHNYKIVGNLIKRNTWRGSSPLGPMLLMAYMVCSKAAKSVTKYYEPSLVPSLLQFSFCNISRAESVPSSKVQSAPLMCNSGCLQNNITTVSSSSHCRWLSPT